MKFLLLFCLLGFAAADLPQQAGSAVDETVMAFMQGAVSARSISEILGDDDPEVLQLADDIETEVSRKVHEALREFLEKIKDTADQGKAIGQELLQKVKEIRQKLREIGEEKGEKAREALRVIREKAKEILRKMLEKLGLGKQNLDDAMDEVARMRFKELVERIREKLSSDETVQKIRDYFRNHVGKSEFIQKLKDVVARLKDTDIREVIRHLFDYRPGQKQQAVALRGETWDKILEFLKKIHVKITEHTKKFGEWIKDMWGKGIEKLKEKHGLIKAIALEYIANAKDLSSELAREALEFFRPYKEDLGALWEKIVDVSKEAIGKF